MRCASCSAIQFLKIAQIDKSYVDDLLNVVFEQSRSELTRELERGNADYRYCIQQPSFAELCRSAYAGCYFCAALLFAFREPAKHWEQGPIDTETAASQLPIVLRLFRGLHGNFEDGENIHWSSLEFCPLGESVYAYCGTCRFQMRREKTPPVRYSDFSHELELVWEQERSLDFDSFTNSETNCELAKMWYSNCREGHHRCAIFDQRGSPVPTLPTRVIDVKIDGENPVLYEPADVVAAEYVALSHCWGQTRPMKIRTTSPSIMSWIFRWLLCRDAASAGKTCALPKLTEWPKTFADAVKITRLFGIRYLWIDNTGIIQGDEADWAKESECMARYFSQATVTIAATGSPSDDAGCFYHRNPFFTRPIRLIAASETASIPHPGFYLSIIGNDRWANDENYSGPLYTRGWVLQEQLLARRQLRFGQQMIYWKCFVVEASEADPQGRDQQPYVYNDARQRPHFPMHIRLADHNMTRLAGRNPYYDAWYRAVTVFTGRNLKFESDVLPAIAGLARAFQDFVDAGDNYIAGIWQQDLAIGLLWNADQIGYERKILPANVANYVSHNSRAPSWSWISRSSKRIGFLVDDKILPGGRNYQSQTTEVIGTQVLDATVTLKRAGAPYGEVTSGSLRLRAKLETIKIDVRPHSQTEVDHARTRLEASTPGPTYFRKLTMEKQPFPNFHDRDIEGDCDLDDPECWSVRQNTKGHEIVAKFVPLLMHSNEEGIPGRVMGLALLKNEEGNYVRIGRAAVNMSVNEWCGCTTSTEEFFIV